MSSWEQITEYVDSRGVRLDVDRDAGVIRNVKVLGLKSHNGRTYPKETIARARELYEGAKVNVDHPADSPSSPRSYSDRIGVLRNPQLGQGGDGLFADFHFNPKHALAEQILWDADHEPGNVGFSHNILAKIGGLKGRTVVEEITRVQSVDLVADPATTKGLFEGLDEIQLQKKGDKEMSETLTLTLESLRAQQPALVEQISKVAVEAFQQSEAEKAKTAKLTTLKEELDAFKLKEKLAAEREAVNKLIEEAKLPETAVSEVFLEQLTTAEPDKRQKIIEDRQELVKAGGTTRPRSKEQGAVDRITEGDVSQMDAKQRRRRYTQ